MAARVTLLLLRLALGGLFVYAGVMKAAATQAFALEIQHYAILPWPDARLALAVYLPWVEIAAGLAVLARRCYLGGLALVAALMLLFTFALASAWTRGLDIQCGCFGKSTKAAPTNFPMLLARDAALLATAGILLAAERRRRQLPAG